MNVSFLQRPSRYLNHEINAVHSDKRVKVALVFPDIYEIGMSHLGLKILYKIINDLPFASAERVFSPWTDLENTMRAKGLPLASLESKRPLREFDIAGFSLQYELSYTTVLNMLSLGGIPVKSEERMEASPSQYPLIIAGGSCTVNPLPMSPFIDAFLIGDGEDAVKEIVEIYCRWKHDGDGRKESLLQAVARIEGMFVPFFHASQSRPHPSYSVRRRILASLDNAPYPDRPVVPFTPIVHDRVNIEVARGCSMGCRFCQAGIIHRPVRERSPQQALSIAETAVKNTGYEEIAFTSLSAGDYPHLLAVVREFNKKFRKNNIAVSLPSLRVSAINTDLLQEISSVRKTGFTIAPEAGSARLRNVINKDFSDEEYAQALRILFKEGWLNLKLYFMIGLPTERYADIEGIVAMAFKALKTAKHFTKRFVNISIGISPFIPKAHTPFQWCGQTAIEVIREKKAYIKNRLSSKEFHIKGHNIHMSLLEAAFARGDARIAALIEKAWSLGCRLDGWTEAFDYGKWEEAMNLSGIDAVAYAEKSFASSDHLPWDIIDIGVSKEFLRKEYEKALSEQLSPDCRKTCHFCGLDCSQSLIAHPSSSGNGEPVADVRAPIVEHTRRFNPVRIRVEFSKTGEMRHLSHLELVTMFHRAMRRASFPLEFSKGYHPSPKVSFGPPLGVGIAGLSEYFDMELRPPFDLMTNKTTLNGTLPDGISVHDMSAIPAEEPSLNAFICRYEYEIKGINMTDIQESLSKKNLLVAREKGTINIRNMIEEVGTRGERTLFFVLADQGDTKVRLGELIPLVCKKSLNELDITRTGLYGWKSGWVKPIERNVQWTAKY